jgi:hypothetical protein
MADYPLTYQGKHFTVTIPPRLEFSRPATDGEAVEAIARLVAPQVLPHVKPLPRRRTLERDEAGQVTGSIEYEPASAEQVAVELGRTVARAHLELDE